MKFPTNILYIGDIVALAVLTIFGFASHGEADLALLPRMAALFGPLVIIWILVATSLGLFRPAVATAPKQLWRPGLTALIVAPLAAVLRGVILRSPVIPIFVVVLTVITALGMTLWRALVYALFRSQSADRQ